MDDRRSSAWKPGDAVLYHDAQLRIFKGLLVEFDRKTNEYSIVQSCLKTTRNVGGKNFERPLTPQTTPFDPNMHSNEISGSSRSPGCEHFSTIRPLADKKKAKKPKRQKTRTLNDRLPLKHRPYRPQTSAKRFR